MPGTPHDPKPTSWGGSGLTPAACVEHRTIGHWAGDYSVLSRSRVPSVHFLVGQDRGQWVQFWDTNWSAAHAAGANEYAVGIEFSGQNGEALTDWQIEAGGEIHRWLMTAHGIPAVFLDDGAGRVGFFRGFLNHSNVATTPQYTHYDYITRAEWDRMVGGAAPKKKKVRDTMIARDDATGGIWLIGVGAAKHIPTTQQVAELQFVTGQEGVPNFNSLTLISWMQKFGAWDYDANTPREVG